MSLIVKKCNNCGKEFTSQPNWNKIYCSHGCYQKAKVFRRVARDKPIPFHNDPDITRFVTILHYPPAEVLDMWAKMVTPNKPVKVVGMNHQWTVPDDIDFRKNEEKVNHHEVWVMYKREVGAMDIFLRMKSWNVQFVVLCVGINDGVHIAPKRVKTRQWSYKVRNF